MHKSEQRLMGAHVSYFSATMYCRYSRLDLHGHACHQSLASEPCVSIECTGYICSCTSVFCTEWGHLLALAPSSLNEMCADRT